MSAKLSFVGFGETDRDEDADGDDDADDLPRVAFCDETDFLDFCDDAVFGLPFFFPLDDGVRSDTKERAALANLMDYTQHNGYTWKKTCTFLRP